MIEIRQAKYEEIPMIMKFIDEKWEKGHILSTDRRLFEWQHVENGEVYFIIAIDNETEQLYGMMGYTVLNHEKNPDVCTMMILTLKNDEYDFLGDAISEYFQEKVQYRYLASPGIREKYAKVLQILNEDTIGVMKQYVRVNEKCESYHIAKVIDCRNPVAKGEKKLMQIRDVNRFRELVEEIQDKNCVPYQDERYLEHRFWEHPYYEYLYYEIVDKEEQSKAIIIAREQKVENSKILRIVNYLGKDSYLAGIDTALDDLMRIQNYEYIDFFCYGIDEEIMKKAGFFENDGKINVFPNFFEPYLQKNGKIYFFTDNKARGHVYKSFSDQDRPRLIQ